MANRSAAEQPPRVSLDPERQRLSQGRVDGVRWDYWGPYLSERQWGTVREDYSHDGRAWHDVPHDHARSRAYRWGEDGLLGISDDQARLCFALALWNGKDPILKERLFGLTGHEGNHGEDVKEVYYLPRRYAHPQLPQGPLQLSATGIPLLRAGGGEPPAWPGPTRVRAARHRGLC